MSKAVRSGRSQFRVSSWLNTLTDTYDYNSHHDEQHIVSTALALLHIAATLPNTNDGKQQERKHITNTLMTNGYPKKFLQQVEHKRVMQQKLHHPKNLYVYFLSLWKRRPITITPSSHTSKD